MVVASGILSVRDAAAGPGSKVELANDTQTDLPSTLIERRAYDEDGEVIVLVKSGADLYTAAGAPGTLPPAGDFLYWDL
jgi:hypothetical protein